jgi:hypothetical protein
VIVTDRVTDPALLLAVSVYVVELLGNTWRVPVEAMPPSPLSMEISVAFATAQRSVLCWPRSIEVGSAVKVSIRAACGRAAGGGGGAGAGAGAGAGGGGAGGAGAFFLQPATEIIKIAPNTAAVSVL